MNKRKATEDKMFKNLHGLHGDMIPVLSLTKNLVNRYGLQESVLEDIQKLAEYMPEYMEHIFFVPSNQFYPFCYYHDYVMMDIFSLNVEVNRQFDTKERVQYQREEMDSLRKKKDFVDFFACMEKKILIRSFIELFKEIPVKQKYEVFRELYTRSEYGFEQFSPALLKEVFAYSDYSEEHREAMAQLKEKLDGEQTVIVYRGVTSESTPIEKAFSWTLSLKVAEFFANRFDSRGRVYQAEVSADKIRDFLPDRNEEEVLILPQDIKSVGLVSE